MEINQLKRELGLNEDCDSKRVVITPRIAKVILDENNSNNRVISRTRVELWKKTMMEDQFKLSNDMITFNEDGVLTNGQHRLTAIVESGLQQEMFVGFGVSNFMGMNTGKTRTVLDNAIIFDEYDSRLKEKDMEVILKAVKYVMYFHNGSYNIQVRPQIEYVKVANKYADKLVELREAGLFSCISVTLPGGERRVLTTSAVYSAYILAYLYGVPLDTISRVHSILRTGEKLSDYDKPILALRDLLIIVHGGGIKSDTKRHIATQNCIYKLTKKSKGKRVNLDSYPYIIKDI